jgi:hypothetical protein
MCSAGSEFRENSSVVLAPAFVFQQLKLVSFLLLLNSFTLLVLVVRTGGFYSYEMEPGQEPF